MASGRQTHNKPQVVLMVACVTILTHFLTLIQPSLAANGAPNGAGQVGESAASSSTQPLWSYQVKPTNNNYLGNGMNPNINGFGAGGGGSSLFDAFTGLSQRQGALTSSPFMSILPIILIAAGGLLLLLPMLTMMMASPFGGAAGGPFGGGGYQNFGYPQANLLSKRRSLDSSPLHQNLGGAQRGLIELIEHVSSTIEDLSRHYNAGGAGSQASKPQQKRASKSLNVASAAATSGSSEASQVVNPPPANHKLEDGGASVNTISSGNL